MTDLLINGIWHTTLTKKQLSATHLIFDINTLSELEEGGAYSIEAHDPLTNNVFSVLITDLLCCQIKEGQVYWRLR